MALMTIVILFLLEIGFRIYSNFTLIYDVEMHKYATKLKMRSNIDGLTHEHIPNSEADLMGVNIKTNNLGFREDIPTIFKDSIEKRIVIVGSSITMGWGVPYDSIYSTKLEKYLKNKKNKNVNVINTGIGNYNSVLESIFIENKIDDLNPDQIILHYFINDAEELSSGTQNFFIKNFYSIAYFYIRIKQAIHSSKNQYKSMGEYYADLYNDESKGWKKARKAINNIKNACDKRDIKFQVLIQPDLHNLSNESLQFKCHSKIKKFLTENNIEFHDLFNAFQNKVLDNPKSIWVNKDDPHPNNVGHEIIFNDIKNYYE